MLNTLISFIVPSRNNLKYLKAAYNSIRQNIKERHQIVMLDDASTDGTWDWLVETAKHDVDVVIYKNSSKDRVGHTVLYDVGVELASHEIFSIFHADMLASPNYVTNMLKHLKPGTIVCATRVEPPLHPSGPEKHVNYFGIEPEEFKTQEFFTFVDSMELKDKDKTTEGIFAPWCMYKTEFQKIGGHDKLLFVPMDLEDSDLFNRLYLSGYTFIQSWDSLVYHFTCRGSRFKDGIEIERVIDLPDGSKWHKPKDSVEYTTSRINRVREWWRKWGTNVLHDVMMKPTVEKIYDIAFVVQNINYKALEFLETCCNAIYIDDETVKNNYIRVEQLSTAYNLYDRVFLISDNHVMKHDIIVEMNMNDFSKNLNENLQFIQNISAILSDSGQLGKAECGIFTFTINKLQDYSKNCIVFNGSIANRK